MDTIYVNLFGAPGSGKSTGAAYVFSHLKLHGVLCELVTEYAKDVCWETPQLLSDPLGQFAIGAEQFRRLHRLHGKVRVCVTDSPFLLAAFYDRELGPHFEGLLASLHSRHRNMDYMVVRSSPYSEAGRVHTQEESDLMSARLRAWLPPLCGSEPTVIPGSEEGYLSVLHDIYASI